MGVVGMSDRESSADLGDGVEEGVEVEKEDPVMGMVKVNRN